MSLDSNDPGRGSPAESGVSPLSDEQRTALDTHYGLYWRTGVYAGGCNCGWVGPDIEWHVRGEFLKVGL